MSGVSIGMMSASRSPLSALCAPLSGAVSAARTKATLETQRTASLGDHRSGCATLWTVVDYFAHSCDRILVGGRARTPGGCVRTVQCCGATLVRCLRGGVLCLSAILSRVGVDGAPGCSHTGARVAGQCVVVAVSCRHTPPMCPRCAVVGWRTTSHTARSRIPPGGAPSALSSSLPTICVDVDEALSARTG